MHKDISDNKESLGELLDFIFNRFPSFQKVGSAAYKPGIEQMRSFASALGEPHNSFKTIHVAGTNGKGSVSYMLASTLKEYGFKVGLYTSPHLVDFRERIKVDGEMISQEYLYSFLTGWKSYFIEKELSFFEITTGMAFRYFADCNVDIAIIETGLGGRLDSTNIISPLLSVITNIGLDHCEYLGNTLEEIAGEKSGIIKDDVPVVIGERDEATDPVFKSKASATDSPLYFAEDIISDIDIDCFPFEEMDLKGEYQRINVRTVLAVCEVLEQYSILEGLRWKNEITVRGVLKTAQSFGMRGRWEKLSDSPLIIADTGHNAHGFRHSMKQLGSYKYDRLYFLIGVVADKDLDSIAMLLPKDAYYLFTKAKGERALSAALLEERLKSYGLQGLSFPSVSSAIDYFHSVAGENDILFIGGSTFIVAEALENEQDIP